MTGQGTETRRLPKAIREALPPDAAEKTRIYAKDFRPSSTTNLADVPIRAGSISRARSPDK